jgi:hypothetical protein
MAQKHVTEVHSLRGEAVFVVPEPLLIRSALHNSYGLADTLLAASAHIS